MPLAMSPQLCDVNGVNARVNTSFNHDMHWLMKRGMHVTLIMLLTMLVMVLQPAYANGGHVHLGLGGTFFLLLGGLLFVGGLGVVFYLLFRAAPESHARDDDGDNGTSPRGQQL